MNKDKWYKTADFKDILGLNDTRIRDILRQLVNDGILLDDGSTKGKRYKKK